VKGDELFDAVVVGTGFGGAVAACRLAQAGKKICILERGRRYGRGEFPRWPKRPDNLPQTARWMWALDQGLWDIKDLEGTLAVQAAGYGGGSLVYANVHLRAPTEVFSGGWPRGYTRASLDRYYDVVAAVLGVQPFPGAASGFVPPAGLPKAEAMRTAARELGREQWIFKPPLAIDFHACKMCAECIAGCQIQAKNTLDLNYLAAAERLGDVDVRTLAEVSWVDEREDAYAVQYHDHIDGTDRSVRAKSVFLCAGAVNTTRLMLASQERLPHVSDATKGEIGRRFYTNGDALAMVFDTNVQPPPKPTLGPTITTALLYNEGRHPSLLEMASPGPRIPAHDWFLIEDGGYPQWMAQLLGMFRGAFWANRNRIAPAQGGRRREDSGPQRSGQLDTTARALVGLLQARYSVGAPGQFALTASTKAVSPLPLQIRQLIDAVAGWAKDRESKGADVISHETLDEVGRRIVASHPALPRTLLECIVNLAKDETEPHLLPSTLKVLHQHYFGANVDPENPFRIETVEKLATDAAQKLIFNKPPGDNAFLMLAMGVDAAPGRLWLEGEELRAEWDLAANMPFATKEERLMQDLAGRLGGELRLNPNATARQQPVSVHALGGCAMADCEEAGVTDPNGKVRGTRGLYILDGAAIPGPIGANPSATIAAIAERNVRLALQDRYSPIYWRDEELELDPPLPGGETLAQIRNKLGQTPATLDPIGTLSNDLGCGWGKKLPEPVARPVGLAFAEIMRGACCNDSALSGAPVRMDLNASIDDLNEFLVNSNHTLRLEGKVWIGPGPQNLERTYPVCGTLDLLKHVGLENLVKVVVAQTELIMAATRTTVEPMALARVTRVQSSKMETILKRIDAAAHRYEMAYDLWAKEGGAKRFSLKGTKEIYDGPARDAWAQTTTLSFTLSEGGGAEVKGVVRVHLGDLLGTQIPSFRVTGTDDDVRIGWAFGRFFRFFFGTLRRVYVPKLRIPDPFADGGKRNHD
jgi:choline dehydrogenase-like flavoprotein